MTPLSRLVIAALDPFRGVSCSHVRIQRINVTQDASNGSFDIWVVSSSICQFLQSHFGVPWWGVPITKRPHVTDTFALTSSLTRLAVELDGVGRSSSRLKWRWLRLISNKMSSSSTLNKCCKRSLRWATSMNFHPLTQPQYYHLLAWISCASSEWEEVSYKRPHSSLRSQDPALP